MSFSWTDALKVEARPSKAEQIINCPVSLRASATLPYEEAGQAAIDGTEVHTWAERGIRSFLHNQRLLIDPSFDDEAAQFQIVKDMMAAPTFSEDLHDLGMDCLEYVKNAIEELENLKDAIFLVEQPVSLEDWVPDLKGTLDFAIVQPGKKVGDPGKITGFDWKSGNIFVSAIENYQLMIYCLGLLAEYDHLYDIEIIELRIFMPRLQKDSRWSITRNELLDWATTVFQPAFLQALRGEGQFNPGDHCKYCRARVICRARAESFFKLADADLTKPFDLLQDEEIVHAVKAAKLLAKWSEDLDEYALRKALTEGKVWSGLKVVESRTVRRYRDIDMLSTRLIKQGYKPTDIFERKLIGITKLKKLLGAKEFGKSVEDLLVRPKGKPTLVPDDDDRPALDRSEAATSEIPKSSKTQK